jgi:hypothetical protein
MHTFKKGFAERLAEQRAQNPSAIMRNIARIPTRANYDALRAVRITQAPFPRYGYTNK